jgi:hypothetical protein
MVTWTTLSVAKQHLCSYQLMAEIIGSAVASEAVSRVSSFLSGDKTGHDHENAIWYNKHIGADSFFSYRLVESGGQPNKSLFAVANPNLWLFACRWFNGVLHPNRKWQ